MSVMGTGIAAGVAQTAHNAQQVARQDDKRRSDQSRASREVRDRYEQLIQDIEEGEAASATTRVGIDDQVPEHQASHEQEVAAAGEHRDPLAALAADSAAMALREHLSRANNPALYRHLDVKA